MPPCPPSLHTSVHSFTLNKYSILFITPCYITHLQSDRMYYAKKYVLTIIGSIIHGVNPLSYFLFQPVLHDWCNKGRGMCYPVCGMVQITEPLLFIGKSSPCGGSGFLLSLSDRSFTICPMPYNSKIKTC